MNLIPLKGQDYKAPIQFQNVAINFIVIVPKNLELISFAPRLNLGLNQPPHDFHLLNHKRKLNICNFNTRS